MDLSISTSTDFVRLRTEKTRAAQAVLATNPGWVWPGKTLAQWDADIMQLDGGKEGTLAQRAIIADSEADTKRSALDIRYTTLHRVTLQAVGVMRARARTDARLRRAVDELSARGDSNRAIEEEGEELLATWKTTFGEAFVPAPGNTYAGFKALFEGNGGAIPSLRALKTDYRLARAEARQEVGLYNELLVRLEDECIQWYAEATAVFPDGTNEGDFIRGEIPTDYNASDFGVGPGGGGGSPESASSEEEPPIVSDDFPSSTSSEG